MPDHQQMQALLTEQHWSAESALTYVCRQLAQHAVQLSSLSVEDQVITHMLQQYRGDTPVTVATIDTGRLPEETYDVIAQTEQKLAMTLAVFFPEGHDVEKLIATSGINGFYNSLLDRQDCCYVRKVKPLTRILKNYDIWITGLRREHMPERGEVPLIEWDASRNMIKINPLYDWTEQAVWHYIKQHDMPYSALYAKGYHSIGCAPCTRAVKAGEPLRSGRWWWEAPQHKECGLHVSESHQQTEKSNV